MAQISKKELISLAVRAGLLPMYESDSAFETALGRSATENESYHNTTTHRKRFHDGTELRDVGSNSSIDRIIDSDVSESITASSADNLKNMILAYEDKILLGGKVEINCAAGDYNPFSVNNIISSDDHYLDIIGDVRECSAAAFVDGEQGPRYYYSPHGKTSLGYGTVSLTPSGNSLSVTRSTSPNFDNAGLVSGDKVRYSIFGGSTGELTVDYVDASLKYKIWFTSAPPAGLSNTGSSIVIVPNRKIVANGSNFIYFNNCAAKVRFRGFEVKTWCYVGSYDDPSSSSGDIMRPGPICKQLDIDQYLAGTDAGLTGDLYIRRGKVFARMLSMFNYGHIEVLNKLSYLALSGVFIYNTPYIYVSGGGKCEIYGGVHTDGSAPSIMIYTGGEVLTKGLYLTRLSNGGSSSGILYIASYGTFKGDIKADNLASQAGYGVVAADGARLDMPTTLIDNYTNGVYAYDGAEINFGSSGNVTNAVTAFSPANSGELGNNGAKISRG